jgi:hypothetical protein
MSYWDVYALPVPIRKYFIKRINKINEETSEQDSYSDVSKPLPPAEKVKFAKKAQQADPAQLKNMFSSRRNR